MVSRALENWPARSYLRRTSQVATVIPLQLSGWIFPHAKPVAIVGCPAAPGDIDPTVKPIVAAAEIESFAVLHEFNGNDVRRIVR